ncbi:6-phosphofructokinase [Enemella dayhoffiae]|uniref:6-phosphofructokinase n=1 Tax=Enemella dayhoffiae TaxID=2016507 RepID=A0A255H3I1_9ACTN|nr:6-phosphofructokinase [Enemella dayhoffiae]
MPAEHDRLAHRVGVLTSGGDAPGMNAAVRAVVRTALNLGADVFVVQEGFQGLVDGGDGIRQVDWDDVGSVLHRGGTIIGTFRSKDFRERAGMRRAAAHLLEHGIDRLVVIGGDGSLSGADEFRREWPGLLAELVAAGEETEERAAAYPNLGLIGLVGSIDNDLVGTDMTIGADTALHRIVGAIDAISSTAASHQRTFVVEVMGRHCGYLALMAAIAGVCDYLLVPEHPPADGWQERMCAELRRGRAAGRRESIVIVAEGTTDRSGVPLHATDVQRVLEERLGEDTRVTILGHVQRGGAPSAYDRWMSTWLGAAAARHVLGADPGEEAVVIGTRGNHPAPLPLVEQLAATRAVPRLIADGDHDAAVAARGGSFGELLTVFTQMSEPPTVNARADGPRIAVVHGGGLAPGMNTAAFEAVRLGIEQGMRMIGVQGGFAGLVRDDLRELCWDEVEGWAPMGGAELGTRREVPELSDLYAIGRTLERHRIDGLLMIGGWDGYASAHRLWQERDRYPAFRIPMICLPASIDNNLPGSELSIGADTALNEIIESIDRIKQSASAARRCFVVEVMGRHCGYLAMMGALGGGAERVYLHEDGVTLAELAADVERLRHSFRNGRRLFLAVRNEEANPLYTTDFMARLFAQEAGGLFDVRQAVLGHVQQGGNPTPFDRILATRLVSRSIQLLGEQLAAGGTDSFRIGLVDGQVRAGAMEQLFAGTDITLRRSVDPWWRDLGEVLRLVAEPPGPDPRRTPEGDTAENGPTRSSATADVVS